MKPPKPDRASVASRSGPSLVEAISRRGTICIACIAIVALTIVVLADANLPVVLYRLIVDGSFCLLWLLAALGWGAIVQRLSGHRIAINLLDFVNSAGLGIGLLSLVTFALGWAGALNRLGVWAILVIGIAFLLVTLRRDLRDLGGTGKWFTETSVAGWLWIIAMPALGIALVAAFAPPGLLWGDEPHGYDVVEYHLQAPREWYESGRVVPLEHNVYTYLPMNVEMHYLLAMHLRGGPWNAMYLAQLMHLALIALAVITVFALAREPAGPPAALVGAIAMAVAPWLLLLAPIAYNDGGLLFFGALAIGWTWRALRDPDQANWKCWALAGAFAGFACGTKLTAVPMLMIGIPIAIVLATVAGKLRFDYRALATFAVTSLLLFSPWLVRNIVYAKNPVFPEAMSVLGRAHFSEVQRERWQRAHSPTEPQRPIAARLKAAYHQIAIDWRYGYTLILAAVFAIALSRTRETWFIATLLAIMLIIWLLFTHLQGRFFVLSIPAAAFAIASGLAAKRQLIIPAAANFAIVAILGMLTLHLNYLTRGDTPGRLALLIDSRALGIETLRELRPAEVDNVPPEAMLVLVGDARAFAYDRPMTLLRYRTVFDVNQPEGESIIDAWAGDDLPADSVLLVDPLELKRMAKNYWKIQAQPPEVVQRASPFLIRR